MITRERLLQRTITCENSASLRVFEEQIGAFLISEPMASRYRLKVFMSAFLGHNAVYKRQTRDRPPQKIFSKTGNCKNFVNGIFLSNLQEILI